MSGAPEKRFSERELRLAERAAYENGMIRGGAREFHGYEGGFKDLQRAVANAFPLPPVERPRVVTYKHREYRAVNGVVEVRMGEREGWMHSGYEADLIRVVADLLANPTETVPDDSGGAA